MKTAIPLDTTERLFAKLHRRFLDRHYPAPPWGRLDPTALPPATSRSPAERGLCEPWTNTDR